MKKTLFASILILSTNASAAGIFGAIGDAMNVVNAIDTAKTANEALSTYQSAKNIGALAPYKKVYVKCADGAMDEKYFKEIIAFAKEQREKINQQIASKEVPQRMIDHGPAAEIEIAPDDLQLSDGEVIVTYYPRKSENLARSAIDGVSGLFGQKHINMKANNMAGDTIFDGSIDVIADDGHKEDIAGQLIATLLPFK